MPLDLRKAYDLPITPALFLRLRLNLPTGEA